MREVLGKSLRMALCFDRLLNHKGIEAGNNLKPRGRIVAYARQTRTFL